MTCILPFTQMNRLSSHSENKTYIKIKAQAIDMLEANPTLFTEVSTLF